MPNRHSGRSNGRLAAGLAAALARDEQVPSPVIQLTAELIRLAHASLGDAADHAESLKLIEQWAAVEIA